MKTTYKCLVLFICAIAISNVAYGANVLVKTTQLGDSITTTGIVRVVIKVTDQHVGRDMGIILHEVESSALVWNAGVGIAMISNISPTVVNSSQITGYDGSIFSWNIENKKIIEKGTSLALWFTIDIVNKTHSLSVQTSTETTPTVVYSNYISRASINSATQLSSKAKYCTVFINDAFFNGVQNTTAAIEVLNDAVIVSSIEAYTNFPSGLISTKSTDNKLTIFPTLATDFINISADEEISSVRIFSLEGKMVLEGKYSNQVEVSALKAGSYIIEAKTISNNVLRKTFLKK